MSTISPTTFPYLILMIVILIILSIALVPIILHKPAQWFLLHKLIMAVAIGAGVLGLIILGILKFDLLHVVVTSIVIILLIVISTGGFVASEKGDQDIRKGHIWLGRVTVIVVMIYIILAILLPL